MNDGKAGFAVRLNAALDQLEIPPKQHGRFTALARLFSVSPTAARDWCEGKSYPSVDKLLLIMDTVRCDADWLLFGRHEGTTLSSLPAASDDARAAPGAGTVDSALEWIDVTGDAMSPTLMPGDQVGIETWQGGMLADGVYALRGPGKAAGNLAPPFGPALIRRVLRCLDGSLELGCDNPLYPLRSRFSEQPAGQLAGISDATVTLVVWGRVVQRRHALP